MKLLYVATALILASVANAQTAEKTLPAPADIKPRTVDVNPPPAADQRQPAAGAIAADSAQKGPPPGAEIKVGEPNRSENPATTSAAPVGSSVGDASVSKAVAPTAKTGGAVAAPELSRDQRADARYNEMRRKITSAVEEVLQLYGNPSFAEVVTNDPEKAVELRQRLSDSSAAVKLKAEIAELLKQRDELKGDVALREREIEQLKGRAARLRATIDQSVMELQRAQRAMEGETVTP